MPARPDELGRNRARRTFAQVHNKVRNQARLRDLLRNCDRRTPNTFTALALVPHLQWSPHGGGKVILQRALYCVLTLAVATPVAHANTVTDWNANAEKAFLNAGVGNAILQSRALSTTQVAVFDAVNSITNEYEPYAVSIAVPPGTSQAAAVAAAAHKVLVAFIPTQQAFLDGAYATSLAAIPDGQAKSDGIALGESVADSIMALRANDGFTSGGTYTPKSSPGYWQPTPPAFGPAIFPLLSQTTPWTLDCASQFRSKAPYELTSNKYRRDLEEVQSLGSANSTTRTQYQTDAAHFWYEGAPLSWDRIARPFSANDSETDSARLFAQLAMSYMDGFIAGFESKYVYEFWRPVTAIRATSDSTWTPLRPTPPHPDHVSTHSVLSGSAAAILERHFGHQTAFTTTGSSTAPGIIRSYRSFKEAAIDNGNSRIWVGVHFRKGVEDGIEMGRDIGKHIVQDFLRPRRGR